VKLKTTTHVTYQIASSNNFLYVYVHCRVYKERVKRGGRLTGDVQPESVGGRFRDEIDSEAALSDERLEHVAHHVDLRVLGALSLSPQHRVVEQVECRRRELTVEL